MLKVCPCRVAVVVGLLSFSAFSPYIASAQSSLALSSSSTAAGGVFSLDLTLSSSNAPSAASIQWTFTYPSNIASLSVSSGASLMGAGKSLSCAVISAGLGLKCIASGQNKSVIQNGVIAKVSAVASGSSPVSVNVTSGVASTSDGNSISVTSTGGVVSPTITVASLVCNPASLLPGAVAVCTVTLTGQAGTGGAIVSLAATGSVTLAAKSLAIAAGSNTATFTATAGQFTSDQSATVTASLNGSTANATIALALLRLVSSLHCGASALASYGNTTCTVSISKAAPAGGTSVALSASISSILTMPAAIVVPSNATSAAFSVSTGLITADQSIKVTASLNGSAAVASLSLSAPVMPSSIACAKSFLSSGGSTSCTVSLTKTVPAGSTASIALSSSNPYIKLSKEAVSAPGGASSVAFTATASNFTSNSNGTLSASLNGASKTVTLSLLLPGSLASLSCAPSTITSGGSGTCTVSLNSALSSAATIALTTSNAALSTPASVAIKSGATSATFKFSVGGSFVGVLTVTAQLGNVIQGAVITVSAAASKNSARKSSSSANDSSATPEGIVPIGLSCDRPFLAGGDRLTCTVDLNTASISDATQIQVASSGGTLAVPSTVEVRAGQSQVRFEVDADPAAPAETAVLEARRGSASVHYSVALLSSGDPSLDVPAEVAGTPGTPLAFSVTAADSHGLDVRIAATRLPGGAIFDPNSGALQWTPSEKDSGVHEVLFKASNTLGASTSKTVRLYVDSGRPIVTRLENGAGSGAPAGCSPGSVATLRGRSLFNGAADYSPAGSSDNLGGTRVWVNGIPAAVLFAAADRVDLLCPTAPPGTSLAISVETANGKSKEMHTSSRESTPGLFMVGRDETQALATLDGLLRLAAIPTARYAATPALPDDMVSFRATGVDCNPQTVPRLSLNVGPYTVPVADTRPVAGYAGVCDVLARVPAVAGDAVPVTLTLLQNDGQQVVSNGATIAVAARQ
jgi:uncharacterized protein (TIGR03437 family)